MPINPHAVGDSSQPAERTWTSKDALIYALGVGAGYPDALDELQFTTENSHGVPQQALPTMAVVLNTGDRSAMRNVGSFNPAALVQGEQKVELHRPLPVAGTVRVTSTVVGIYDKGSGALLVLETSAVDPSTGEPVYTNTASAFIRGEGGFGGDRGASDVGNVAPERAPDHEVTYRTKPDQALIYRLSGDRNPLHSDPSFAKRGGFDRPIMHGLCTYGFTGRALLHALCGSDPARFSSIEGRFSKPAYPGDALTVSMWVDGNDAVFRTSVDATPVIENGRCTFRS